MEVFLTRQNTYRGNFRITVVIPSTDRLLVHWPKYFRKHGIKRLSYHDPSYAREAEAFYVYFGAITKIKTVEPMAELIKPAKRD
jgi:hypothetical protein